MACHFLLQGIFLTQGPNPCLLRFLHFKQILLPLCHLFPALMGPRQVWCWSQFSSSEVSHREKPLCCDWRKITACQDKPCCKIAWSRWPDHRRQVPFLPSPAPGLRRPSLLATTLQSAEQRLSPGWSQSVPLMAKAGSSDWELRSRLG